MSPLTTNLKSLPKAIIPVWIAVAIINVIISIAVMIGAWFAGQHFFPHYAYVVWILGGLILAYDIVDFCLIPYKYRFWKYAITEEFVYLQSGFFLRTQEMIPINRIQNVNLNQGPFLQVAKLKELRIHTAARAHKIVAITEDEANDLRNQIVEYARKAKIEHA